MQFLKIIIDGVIGTHCFVRRDGIRRGVLSALPICRQTSEKSKANTSDLYPGDGRRPNEIIRFGKPDGKAKKEKFAAQNYKKQIHIFNVAARCCLLCDF